MSSVQRWHLHSDDQDHVVEIEDVGLRRRVVWRRDERELAAATSGDERVRLVPEGDGDGAVAVRFGHWGPARRVTWFDDRAEALLGVGGLDFEPEPGSSAAARESWNRAHPRLFTVRQTLVAVATVVVPLVLALLAARFAFSLPSPDWELPRIPWPGLPAIPWPDVDLPAVPGWVREVLSKVKYVGPVVLAFVVARAEIRRRRQQDERRSLDSAHDDGTHRPGHDRDGR